MVKNGQFREDLYFRLHVVPILLPPLRERKEDIPYLTEYFLHIFSKENNKQVMKISGEAQKKMIEYNWPGNIRELKNVIERTVIMADDHLVKVSSLPREILTPQFDSAKTFLYKGTLKSVRESIEADYIKYCLEQEEGNIARTAQMLNVDRTYLYKKLKKMGIEK